MRNLKMNSRKSIPDALRRAWQRIVAFFRKVRLDDELDAEMESHLAMATEDYMRRGMSREEAGRRAHVDFGGMQQARERQRAARGLPWLDVLGQDLRFALRQAAKAPRFTVAAVATLAIGIGLQTAVYSVVHAVLIDPYPYQGAMRMVHVHLYDKEAFPRDLALNGPQYADFRKSPVLDGSTAEDRWSMALTGEELPLEVQVDRISPDAFENFFGVPALLGREFTAADGAKAAVVSYHFWKSHYAGRSDVGGKELQLDHESYTILGVLPQRFAWGGSDVYIPLAYSPDPHRIANVFARVRIGVSDEAAEQALNPMLEAFARETPGEFPPKFKAHLVHINEVAIGRFRGVLVILFLSVSLLLALACVNVAILLLARGEARQAEMGLRKALGAARGRIVVQLLTEAVLLSALGGAGGVLVALGCIRLVRHSLVPLPMLLPPEADIALSQPVLLFSLAASMLTGILCGLWPALRASRASLRQSADAGSQRLAGRRGVRRGHTILLTAQVAITVLLLGCSGATLHKLEQLIHANLGYDPHHLVAVNITLSEGDHHDWGARVHYFEEIRRAAATDPGVEAAAMASENLPPSIIDTASVTVAGSTTTGGQVVPARVGRDYFAALRIPMLSGRTWTEDEINHAAHMAVINETMKRLYWPHSDPIGQMVMLNNGVALGNVWTLVAPGGSERYQVIGVVGDVPNRGLDEQVTPSVYVPYSMVTYDWFNLMLRTRGDTAGLLHRIREQVHKIDARQAVGDMVTAEDMLEGDTLGRERFVASLFTAFAVVGLVFAACGLYCVQSYLVAQRTRELGVRIALGAPRAHIILLVTQSSAAAVMAGTGIGIALTLALSGVFANWTSGDARSPALLCMEVAVLFAAAGLASIIPARLAASIVPMDALRTE